MKIIINVNFKKLFLAPLFFWGEQQKTLNFELKIEMNLVESIDIELVADPWQRIYSRSSLVVSFNLTLNNRKCSYFYQKECTSQI